MVPVQIACLAAFASYFALRARLEARPIVLLRRALIVAAAAWLAEDTSIRAYGFHEYGAGWWLLLDRVPLLVVLMWPVVAQSARDLATCLWAGRDRPSALKVAFTVLGLVLADAALIQPIAVRSGLVRWTEPGLFGVPPIGMLGCAAFAAIAVLVIERAAWEQRPRLEALALVAAPAGAHVLLFAAWWGAFRWVNVSIPPWLAVAVAWLWSVLFASLARHARTRQRVPPALLWLRAPAALLFLVLLGLHGRDDALLLAYSLAFAPPYLALLSLGPKRPRFQAAAPASGERD
jgi:hypothetical protein